MGKALEEIDKVLQEIKYRLDKDIYTEEKKGVYLMLQGQKAVIIALEDIAKAIREIK